MKDSILDGFKRWKDYSGRSTRRQFWWFYLFFLSAPILSLLSAFLFTIVFQLLDQFRLGQLSIFISFTYLLLVPSMISLQVRRMHDVGKSGWLFLIPIYNHFLYVQPSFEQGRLSNWILAERVSLGFVGVLILSFFAGDRQQNLIGLAIWSLTYVILNRRNRSKITSRNKIN